MVIKKKFISFREIVTAAKQGATVLLTIIPPKPSRNKRKQYLQGLKTIPSNEVSRLIVPEIYPATLVPNKNLPNQVVKERSLSKRGRRIKVVKGSRLEMSGGLPSLGRRRK